jgi:hypothetical protein
MIQIKLPDVQEDEAASFRSQRDVNPNTTSREVDTLVVNPLNYDTPVGRTPVPSSLLYRPPSNMAPVRITSGYNLSYTLRPISDEKEGFV